MADVLGTFAPKPLVVVTDQEDPLFPIATKTALQQLQKIYAAQGAHDRLALVIGTGGHRFYAEQAWQAARPLFGM